MNKLVALLFAAMVLVAIAAASITVSAPTVTPIGSNYQWTYSINGDGLEQLVAGNYANCMGGGSCGTFFTIYDFQGYVPGTVGSSVSGWTASVQNVGLTPSNQIIADDPSVVNLIFTYTGATIPVPTSITSGFFAQSTNTAENTGGAFSYEAQNISNTSAPDQGHGPVNVPGSAPEPASLVLIGSGLLAVGSLRRKFVR